MFLVIRDPPHPRKVNLATQGFECGRTRQASGPPINNVREEERSHWSPVMLHCNLIVLIYQI